MLSIRSKVTRRVADTFVLQHRLQHQPSRTIKVQLLADVQGLGRQGSIQYVTPGRMRSVLHPQKKAVYLLRNATPQPSTVAEEKMPLSLQEEFGLADLKSRLRALDPLVFHRPLSISTGHSLPALSAEGQAIHRSVTLHDISQRLSKTYNLSLVPPNAVLTFQDKNLKEEIETTGSFIVLVHLRSEDIISLRILVEPELA